MANKTLFKSYRGNLLPQADTVNEAGGSAYRFSDKHALAQYAATGCLNGAFYADALDQLATVLGLCARVEAEFIARCAVYCREKGFMKDLPAMLCAVLSVKDGALLERIFPRVIDNGRMLRTFVQIVRSGAVGRKSLGSRPRRLVRRWLDSRNDDALFRASVGNDPSMADVIRMVHPRPATASRAALYAYMIGRDYDAAALPGVVRALEDFKAGRTREVPDVPFQFLSSLELDRDTWTAIALNSPWQALRQNLNTFARHGVYKDKAVVKTLADRIRDPEQVARSRVFPYQLLVAYTQTGADVPPAIREALQDAMELAIANVPAFEGKVYVCPDVSGSMQSPVTGYRPGATSVVRCVEVAALVAAAVLRRNPDAEVIPFSDDVVKVNLNPRDSVMTNAQILSRLPAGGTNCSAPLAMLNRRHATGDLVFYVSDNQSWIDSTRHGATATMRQWAEFKRRSPGAKMVCLDLQPYGSTQVKDGEDILNVGGFADEVFRVVSLFAKGELGGEHWLKVIESVPID